MSLHSKFQALLQKNIPPENPNSLKNSQNLAQDFSTPSRWTLYRAEPFRIAFVSSRGQAPTSVILNSSCDKRNLKTFLKPKSPPEAAI